MREALGPSYRAAAAAPELPVDGALTPRAATLELAAQLESAGPYGQGNPGSAILPAVGAAHTGEGNHGRTSPLRVASR